MKVQHLAAATLAGCTMASAWAQSGITLAGVMDGGLRRTQNAGKPTVSSLASGGNSTSRLIVRGTEDLGDGMSASFHLEAGLLLDNGLQAGTAFWDRRSTVSVASPRWGELRAGRDYTPSYTNWTRHDPFSYVGVAGSTNLLSSGQQGPVRAAFGGNPNPNTLVRANNTVQWLLPAGWGGLEGGVMVALRADGTSANGQHKVEGARLGWGTKTFKASAALTHTTSNLTTLGRFKDLTVGASQDFGVARVSAAWRKLSYGPADQTNLLLGLWVPVGLGELKASWHQAKLSGRVGTTNIGANDSTQWGLGYVYNLSRRSALYASLSQVSNQGAATFTVPGGATGITAGGQSRGYEVGVRHNF